MQVTIDFTKQIIKADNPKNMLEQALERLGNIFKLRLSGKHMSGRDLGRLDETDSLKYKKIA